jgi:chemotaxis protein methyltransferase CheR
VTELEEVGRLEYDHFRRHVLALTQIDLNQYKREQLLRRLATLRRRANVGNLSEYVRRLTRDPAELEAFRSWFAINVTEFFRDPARWADLRERVLPRLLRQRAQLRVWSAGCSEGDEPYSLAMLLAEFRGTGPHYLLATDIDPAALAVAQAGGPYHDAQMRNLTQLQQRCFFHKKNHGEDGWWVRPELQRQVTFRRANLLSEAPDWDFDLIVCRNVIIYFTEDAKRDVLARFDRALRPGGALFLGGTELVQRANEFGLTLESPSMYRHRPEGPVSRPSPSLAGSAP